MQGVLAAADPARTRSELADALVRTGTGDRAALARVYLSTSAKLFGICLRILHSRQEAEDALQDIYVNVWRKASSFDPERASPITWLAVIARNRAIDRARRNGSRRFAPLEEAENLADRREDAAGALEEREEAGRLTRCIGELEERQATAIRTAFFDGLTYSELAERQSVPLGTMKSWVRRGLARLRDCLDR